MSLPGGGRHVWRWLGLQVVASVLLMGCAGGVAGLLGLKSAGLACLAYAVPYSLALWMTFRHQGARAAKLIVRSFYRSEALKMAVSMILFALIFAFLKLVPWVFFGAYISMQLTMWLWPMVIENR